MQGSRDEVQAGVELSLVCVRMRFDCVGGLPETLPLRNMGAERGLLPYFSTFMMYETCFSETTVSKPRRLEYEIKLIVSSGKHSS